MPDFSDIIRTVGGLLLDSSWASNRLTVLTYHRVNYPYAADFRYAQYNVSATPEQFSQQMDYIAAHYNVIGLKTLVDYVRNQEPLPHRALLITFDDGYKDNLTYAFPILQKYHFPAVLFLATGFINQSKIPWWDQCAYYFRQTSKKHATLPLIGDQSLETPEAVNTAHDNFVQAIKQLSDDARKQGELAQLPTALEVVPIGDDETLFLTWDEVRQLVAGGIACQAHTVTHPIMSQVTREEADYQLAAARAEIEQQTDKSAIAFAYPNGSRADYTEVTMQLLRDQGYQVAFTMTPGPMQSSEARQAPLELRRNHVRHSDPFSLFTLKLIGVQRLKDKISELRT